MFYIVSFVVYVCFNCARFLSIGILCKVSCVFTRLSQLLQKSTFDARSCIRNMHTHACLRKTVTTKKSHACSSRASCSSQREVNNWMHAHIRGMYAIHKPNFKRKYYCGYKTFKLLDLSLNQRIKQCTIVHDMYTIVHSIGVREKSIVGSYNQSWLVLKKRFFGKSQLSMQGEYLYICIVQVKNVFFKMSTTTWLHSTIISTFPIHKTYINKSFWIGNG